MPLSLLCFYHFFQLAAAMLVSLIAEMKKRSFMKIVLVKNVLYFVGSGLACMKNMLELLIIL
jgi:hypothetical protein